MNFLWQDVVPVEAIDFHHRHIVEAFTTLNKEESAAIERKWQVTLTMGFHKIVGFSPPSHSCCINVTILYLWVTVMLHTSHFYLYRVLVSSERYLVCLQKYPQRNKFKQITFRLSWQNTSHGHNSGKKSLHAETLTPYSIMTSAVLSNIVERTALCENGQLSWEHSSKEREN